MTPLLLWFADSVADGGLPDSFAYVAIGWAVSVTSAVAGLVLGGKLVLGRELAFVAKLYESEKTDREKIELAFKETAEELRLQNKTLATTVDVLQKNMQDRDSERSRLHDDHRSPRER